ncbi:MAG: hypothetical protein ACOH2E_06720 [Candidatus Paracaedibacter sp.]
MIRIKFTHIARQMTLLVSTILLCTNDASSLNVDATAFCTDSCKSPGLCSTEPNLKSQCKKVCSPDHIWKQSAKLQMSRDSKDFRMEEDAGKKDKMLYDSPLAKCLELTQSKTEEAKPLPPAAPTPVPVVKIPDQKEDLCTAALKKAMTDLESNKSALDHGRIILESQKQELATALKAHGAK